MSRTPGCAGLGGQWVPTPGAGWSESHRRSVILRSQFLETSPSSFVSFDFLPSFVKQKAVVSGLMLGSEILIGTKRMDMVWLHVCLVVIF